MDDFNIFKGVPIPNKRIRWPFKNMAVGDCAQFNSDVWGRAVKVAHTTGYLKKWKFVTRISDTGGTIWRVQ